MTNDGQDLIRNLMQAVQAQAARPGRVIGSAGGGAVQVEMEGFERVISVTIAPDALSDGALLGDLVAAAVNDALAKAKAASMAAAEQLLGGLPGLTGGQGAAGA